MSAAKFAVGAGEPPPDPGPCGYLASGDRGRAAADAPPGAVPVARPAPAGVRARVDKTGPPPLYRLDGVAVPVDQDVERCEGVGVAVRPFPPAALGALAAVAPQPAVPRTPVRGRRGALHPTHQGDSYMKVLLTLAAAVAAVVTLGPAPAGATPEPPTQSADGSVCGEVTLSGTAGQYNGNYLLHWFVEEDPANSGNVPLPGSDTVTFDEDYGDGEISVVFHSTGPEADENLDPEEVTVDTDCAEPTVPTTEPTEPPTTEPTDPTVDPVSPTPAGPAAPVAPAASPVVAQPQFTG